MVLCSPCVQTSHSSDMLRRREGVSRESRRSGRIEDLFRNRGVFDEAAGLSRLPDLGTGAGAGAAATGTEDGHPDTARTRRVAMRDAQGGHQGTSTPVSVDMRGPGKAESDDGQGVVDDEIEGDPEGKGGDRILSDVARGVILDDLAHLRRQGARARADGPARGLTGAIPAPGRRQGRPKGRDDFRRGRGTDAGGTILVPPGEGMSGSFPDGSAVGGRGSRLKNAVRWSSTGLMG